MKRSERENGRMKEISNRIELIMRLEEIGEKLNAREEDKIWKENEV